MLLTSKAKVVVADTAPEGAVATERDDLWLNVTQSAAAKCDRCWHHVEDVGTIAGHEEICGRCVTNVEGDGETRQFA
ncbi:Isoleucine--tRNA ligase [compost metagenome]